MYQIRWNQRTGIRKQSGFSFPVLFLLLVLLLIGSPLTACRATAHPSIDKAMQGATSDPTRSARPEEASLSIPEEQKLVVYTAHKEEVYRPILQEFEEQTGIYVEVHTGGTTELLHAIRAGEADGQGDIMFGGGAEILEAYRDCFSAFETDAGIPLAPELQSRDHIWTPFTELPIVFIYNNKLVSREEAPKSWSEFLTDRWRGKVSFADPAKSGTSYTILQTMSTATGQSMSDILSRFIDTLDGNLATGSGDVLQKVASGDMLVGITLEESAMKEIVRGNDISMVYPKEGTSAVPDGAAILNGAPHRENAERFMQFILSDGVQKFVMTDLYRRPVRTDLSNIAKTEGLSILPFDLKKAGQEEPAVLEAFRRMRGAR